MAKYDGKDMEFKFGAFAIPTGHLVSVDWPDVRDELEATGAGQDDKEFHPSERSGTIVINGWDDVAGTIRTAFLNTTVEATAEFYPQGNTSGKPKKSASAFVTQPQLPLTHNQIAPFTINFRVNGATTNSTVA